MTPHGNPVEALLVQACPIGQGPDGHPQDAFSDTKKRLVHGGEDEPL